MFYMGYKTGHARRTHSSYTDQPLELTMSATLRWHSAWIKCRSMYNPFWGRTAPIVGRINEAFLSCDLLIQTYCAGLVRTPVSLKPWLFVSH